MIPILNVVNWFTKNFKVIAVSFIMLLTAISFYMNNQLKNKNIEISRLQNNIEYYSRLNSDYQQNNIQLQLTIDELNDSKDSLIQQIKTVQDKLNIKDKNLISANVVNTEIKDSIKTIINNVDRDFKEELKLNQLTTITVSRQDSILTAKLELYNQQILLVEQTKQYKKQYKNKFIRFLHFDWRKKTINKYQINNSNDLIKVTNTRVIEIIK